MNWLYVLIFPSLLLAANPEIHWLRFHFPPSMFYLPGDSRDNSGFSDFSRNTMIQNTPEYRHVDYTESIHRAFKDAKENPDITLCFSGINKNAERESFLLYSSSFLKSFPNQLIVRTDNARIDRVLNADGTISLQRFLENGLTLSIAKSRSYSPVIDSLLQKFSKKT